MSIGTFREWLINDKTKNEQKHKEYKDFLNSQFVIESFDTTHEINNVQLGDPDFHYFKIDYSDFRIFVEKAKDNKKHLHIGFEYRDPYIGWTTKGIYDELSTKNVLAVFGTVYKVLKGYDFSGVAFCSNEPKKFRIYIRMMDRLAKDLNLKNVSHDDVYIWAFNDEEIVQTTKNHKFKYKSK